MALEMQPATLDAEGTLLQVVTSTSALEAQTKGEIDVQINTAKRFPRDVGLSLRRATALATMSEDTAKSCWYSLPRGRDGNIEGKSVRLAEIAMNCWGNMRAQTLVVGMDSEVVTVEGRAFDLESNVAVSQQVQRRIVGSNGKRYSTDMLVMTVNACASIALRNAIFKVIPGPFTDEVLSKARSAAIGDIATFPAKRDKVIAAFLKLGVREEQIFAALGVTDRQGITGDHYLTLEGFWNAIKQDGVSIESIFAPPPGPAPDQGKGLAAVKAKANGAKAAAETVEATPEPAAVAEPAPAAQPAMAVDDDGFESPGGFD